MADPAPGGADFARIRAANPGPMTLSGTNTYVVGREPAYVIDPGPDDAAHLDAVRVEGEARGGIAGVLLTHSHADHSAGVSRLGAPLLWGAVSAGHEADWHPEPAADRVRDLPPSFTAVATPGHASDHTCFVWDSVCFCGDLILGEGSTIVPPRAFGGSMTEYMRSLEAVRGLDATLFAPGHGEWITDPLARIEEYVAHRGEREARLVAALDAGELSRSRLLALAWPEVPAALELAAAAAMEAHLEKLADEGRDLAGLKP